ncbi:MAG: uracil phosphoribosyltransferase, partial [Candidatus Eremiobacterota bacterium]
MALHVLEHPLIQHKLTWLRDTTTGPKEFRSLVEEIATLMAYEATRDLPLEEVEVETPLVKTFGRAIVGKKLALVPILRAGLGMVEGIVRLIPHAKIGHIGLYRDHETLQPVEYYCKVPDDLAERDVFVLDPMLATGGSAAAAINFLKQRGARSKNIRFLCLLASPEGIEVMRKNDPEVDVYTSSVDDG